MHRAHGHGTAALQGTQQLSAHRLRVAALARRTLPRLKLQGRETCRQAPCEVAIVTLYTACDGSSSSSCNSRNGCNSDS